MSILRLWTAKHLLVFIYLLFFLTRFYKISEIPASLYWDEASIGYNAYSISKDGKDEWGDFLPLHFRAFGEFKLPVYIYSVVPFVKIFGLNEFSVRAPAVLFSLGVVILTFLLAKKLTGSEPAGLWSSFFITISPWFFIFSRTGYEASAGLTFYLLGILISLQKREGRYFFFSILSFIISAYSYNSFRIVAPLTILILAFIERDAVISEIKKSPYWLIVASIFIVLSILPIYRLYVYDAGSLRFQFVGATNLGDFFNNYLSHFGADFLFAGDKNLRSQQAGFGQIFLPDFVFLPLGFLYIIKSKSKYKFLLPMLVLVGLIPSALTKEAPHALRSVSLVPFLSIISAYGVIFLKRFSPKKYFVEVAISVIFLVFFINYFINFLTAYSYQSAKDWQYGYKKLFTESKFENSDHVLVSDKDGQPYIFALFYLKYDPEKFRSEVVRNPVENWGFSTVKKFGKFEFGE